MQTPLPRARIFRDPIRFIVTWGGAGLSPRAPGTVGSAAALPFAALIHATLGGGALLAASLLLCLIGIKLSDRYMEKFSRMDDPGEIVIDEVAGVWLTLAVAHLSVESYLLGFLAFRFFDIVKPWPVSWADTKLEGGLGVMMDDMLAGVMAAAVLILAEMYVL
jgi:phosphatidylglycerophosphatase A